MGGIYFSRVNTTASYIQNVYIYIHTPYKAFIIFVSKLHFESIWRLNKTYRCILNQWEVIDSCYYCSANFIIPMCTQSLVLSTLGFRHNWEHWKCYTTRSVLNSDWVVWVLIVLVFYILRISIWFYPSGNQQGMSMNPFAIGAVYCSKYYLESLWLPVAAYVYKLAWPFK